MITDDGERLGYIEEVDGICMSVLLPKDYKCDSQEELEATLKEIASFSKRCYVRLGNKIKGEFL